MLSGRMRVGGKCLGLGVRGENLEHKGLEKELQD